MQGRQTKFHSRMMKPMSVYPTSNIVKLADLSSYFSHFEGHQDCGFTSKDLYTRPVLRDENTPKHTLYCRNRATLLEAMSEGGRHGFERVYSSAPCHYRWYSTAEICMILERFDAIVFIGDDTIKHVYAAFNMLLREDIARGGLKQWDLTESERVSCRCDNQFMKPECSKHFVTDSLAVTSNDESSGHKSPYYCDRKSIFPLESQADSARNTSYVFAHHRLSSLRRSPLKVHVVTRQRSGCLQTHSGDPFSVTGDIAIVVISNVIHGRMGLSGRCFRSECALSLAGTQCCWSSQTPRPDPKRRQQCDLALHSGDGQGSEG